MTDQEKLAQLQPDFANLIVKLMEAVKARGHELMISEGYRSFDRQNALYAKGRTTPGAKVTNAMGGQSYHNYGLAADLALKEPVNGDHFPDVHPVWSIIGEEARKLGLTWGGDFKTIKDRPHVEIKIALAEIRKTYDKGGRDATWLLAKQSLTSVPATADTRAEG